MDKAFEKDKDSLSKNEPALAKLSVIDLLQKLKNVKLIS